MTTTATACCTSASGLRRSGLSRQWRSGGGAVAKLPKALSKGEETFALHCQAHKLTPVREYRFDVGGRKWKFDFAWPSKHLAVEIEGGTWNRGRHTTGAGFEKDCVKYSEAAAQGWRVIRVTTGMVVSGEAIAYVLRAL